MKYFIDQSNITCDSVQIENVSVKLFRIKDVENLLDQITDQDFSKDERLPYWAELWPSALAMAEFILQNPQLFKHKKVLELGCGLGLSGIAATFAGAEVVFSDYERQALEFVDKNYRLNFGSEPQLLHLDWRKNNFNLKFEIILAADVLYEKRFFKPVLETVDKILSTGGIFVLAEPNRPVAVEILNDLRQQFSIAEELKKKIESDQKLITVNILVLKKC